MFFHIGGDYVVKDESIVGIFDIDNCSTGKRTREFFKKNQQNGRIVDTVEDIPKSFIVTGEKNQKKIYILGVSSATLKKRISGRGYGDIEME